MLGISTTNLRVNGFRGKGFDADAQAFITAAGITDATQKNAINRLVKNYKGVGDLNANVDLWTGSKAIYPFVGGSATSHKFNMKDPRDTDTAFRLSFSGGWTHNLQGITGNGTNSFANSFLNANSNLLTLNSRVAAYIKSNINESKYDVGCRAAGSELMIAARYGDLFYCNMGSTASYGTTSNTNSSGLFACIRADITNTLGYKNGILQITHAETEVRPNANIYLGAVNNAGTAQDFSSKNYAFFVLGASLSSVNLVVENNIIQAFQTDLSRQV